MLKKSKRNGGNLSIIKLTAKAGTKGYYNGQHLLHAYYILSIQEKVISSNAQTTFEISSFILFLLQVKKLRERLNNLTKVIQRINGETKTCLS